MLGLRGYRAATPSYRERCQNRSLLVTVKAWGIGKELGLRFAPKATGVIVASHDSSSVHIYDIQRHCLCINVSRSLLLLANAGALILQFVLIASSTDRDNVSKIRGDECDLSEKTYLHV